MSNTIPMRTFPTAVEAHSYLDDLLVDGYRIVGAPGTDTWLAEREDVILVVKVEP